MCVLCNGNFFRSWMLIFSNSAWKRFFKPLEVGRKIFLQYFIKFFVEALPNAWFQFCLCSKCRYLFCASLEWHHKNNSQCIVVKQIILFCILFYTFSVPLCYVVLIVMNSRSSDRRVVIRARLVVCTGFSLALGYRLSCSFLDSVPVNLYHENSIWSCKFCYSGPQDFKHV